MDVNATLDLFWVVMMGILVFFMQAGFTLFEAGLTSEKNIANIAMKNIMDIFVGIIAFWAVGYSLMYGDSVFGLVGELSMFYVEPSDMHNLLFQTVFCATAATIISGSIAERAMFPTYIIFTFLFTTFIYPIAGHWIWQTDGWLTQLGFIDFSGATAVHLMGGFAALVYAALLGPRAGKYGENGEVYSKPGHNTLFAVLGVFILWMGWFGLNAGSTLSITGESGKLVPLIILNTNLAAASAGIFSLVISWILFKKASITKTLNGTLGGLVSITAGCSVVTPVGALAIGAVAGVLVTLSTDFVEKKLKIDDAVSAFSVHGVGGFFGTILVGLFASETGLVYSGDFEQLKVQTIGGVAVAVWSIIITFVVVVLLKYTVGIRVPLKYEMMGLDNMEHNIDFEEEKSEEIDQIDQEVEKNNTEEEV